MTSFDWGVIAVLVLSTGFAVIRGALREIGTVIALLAGLAGAYFLVKPLQAAAGLGHSFMTTLAVGGVLVVIGFVLAYFGLHLGLSRVRLSGKSLLADRIGGGVFGFVRGLVLIGLGFLAYSYYLDEARRPEAVTKALTLPLARGMASAFEGLAPESTNVNADEPDKPVESDANAAIEGYARSDRSALSEIVTTVTTSDTPGGTAAQKASASSDPIATLLKESEPE